MIRHALLAILLLLLVGCSTGGANRPEPTATARPVTPMRFRPLRQELNAALVEAGRGDAAALRRRSPALSNQGLAVIKATLPHDVARTDVPRYLDGRAVFGAALKHWVTVVESGSDAQVLDALRRLDDAARGWVDAYLGLAPETSI